MSAEQHTTHMTPQRGSPTITDVSATSAEQRHMVNAPASAKVAEPHKHLSEVSRANQAPYIWPQRRSPSQSAPPAPISEINRAPQSTTWHQRTSLSISVPSAKSAEPRRSPHKAPQRRSPSPPRYLSEVSRAQHVHIRVASANSAEPSRSPHKVSQRRSPSPP